MIVLSDNLLMVFFGWEGVGLASYALIGFWCIEERLCRRPRAHCRRHPDVDFAYTCRHEGFPHDSRRRCYDACRYVPDLHIRWNIWIQTGRRPAWAIAMSQQNLLVLQPVLLFGGAVGKSAQFPLNEWLLEAMTGPTAVSALIHAATMVKAGVFLVARIGPLFFALASAGAFSVEQFFEVIAWVGAITAFLLATQALVNPEIKNAAYSTGSQIGYMMMGLGIAGLSLNFVDGYTVLPLDKPCDVQGVSFYGAHFCTA